MGLGPTGSHPPSLGASGLSPSHGREVEALRPAWAIWSPGTAYCSLMNAVMGRKASVWASDQMPESCGEILPSGDTAVASTMTSAAPPTALLPRWTRCQFVARPSRLEY